MLAYAMSLCRTLFSNTFLTNGNLTQCIFVVVVSTTAWKRVIATQRIHVYVHYTKSVFVFFCMHFGCWLPLTDVTTQSRRRYKKCKMLLMTSVKWIAYLLRLFARCVLLLCIAITIRLDCHFSLIFPIGIVKNNAMLSHGTPCMRFCPEKSCRHPSCSKPISKPLKSHR